ncbi:M protein [strawberry-associated virus 1]|uniref:M protein n=1 Tax=strawberry-associated virus 1 TaxID=2594796 RepID=A0A514TP68_9RHAB|nr:M protein [Strawberry associated virus 1]
MLKLKNSLSSAKATDAEQPSPPEKELSDWVCVSAYIKAFEVEIGDQRASKSFEALSLEHSLISLIESTLGGDTGTWISSVLTFFLKQGRWGKCVDCRTSPYLGPRTKRVSYLLDRVNILFQPPSPKFGKVTISAVGKKSIIDGTPVRATIKMDIVTKAWDQETVDKNTESHPDWFCGPMA